MRGSTLIAFVRQRPLFKTEFHKVVSRYPRNYAAHSERRAL